MEPSYFHAMSDAEVAEYMECVEPPSDPRLEKELASRVEESVATSPTRFLTNADRYLERPMPYVEALVRGLHRAVDAGCELDGESVVRLVASLFDSQPAIDIRLRKSVWAVIEPVCDDTEPSLRGQALHKVVRYARWVHWHEAKRVGESGSAFNMDAIPEVRCKLERHLNPKIERSPSVRSVYGQWFPHLCLLDEEWARRNVDAIFSDRYPLLRDSAWDTYLTCGQFCITPFVLLHRKYAAAIQRLASPGTQLSASSAARSEYLGQHLLRAAGNGVLSWSGHDNLLRAYFLHAEPDDAAAAVRWMGRFLHDKDREFRVETIQRFEQLTDALLDMLNAEGDRLAVPMSALGSWIASGRFDAEWALSRLCRLVKLAGTAEPVSGVTKYLAELADDYPAETFRVVKAWVERVRRGSELLTTRIGRIHQVLRAALNDDSVSDEAQECIYLLVDRVPGLD